MCWITFTALSMNSHLRRILIIPRPKRDFLCKRSSKRILKIIKTTIISKYPNFKENRILTHCSNSMNPRKDTKKESLKMTKSILRKIKKTNMKMKKKRIWISDGGRMLLKQIISFHLWMCPQWSCPMKTVDSSHIIRADLCSRRFSRSNRRI